MVLYPKTGTDDLAQKTNTALYAWANFVQSQLPLRAMTNFCIDGNDRLGSEHGRFSTICDVAEEEMGLTGLLLAEFCESWSLAPINTYFDIGGTCFPGPNRIDFVGGTSCLLSQTTSCEVWHHSGDLLHFKTGHQVDHRVA